MKLYKQKQQVKAMKILQENYKMKITEVLVKCPLCQVIKLASCEKCVWSIETGNACTVAIKGHQRKFHTPIIVNPEEIRKMRNAWLYDDAPMLEGWRKRRLRELNKWIKKYEV